MQDWPGGSGLFNFAPSANNQSLLDPREAEYLGSFFQNPEVAADGTDEFTLNWPPETKMDTGGFEAHHPAMQGGGHAIRNPAATLAGTSGSAYKIHSNQQSQPHSQLATPAPGGFGSSVNDPAAAEAESAASGLFHMAHGHDQESHAAQDSSDIVNAVSWGSLFNHSPFVPAQNQNNLRPPMAPNHTNQAVNAFMDPNHQSAVPDGLTGDGRAWWSDQMHMPANAHTSYGSMQFNPDPRYQNFNLPQHVPTGQQFPPNTQGFHRPPLMTYGSDPNFSTQGYLPPQGYAQIQREKSANLNNVPMAGEAAASARSHVQYTTSGNHGQQRQRHSLPNNSSPHLYTGISSPGIYGGLPTLTSPANPRQSAGLGYGNMAVPTIENGDGHASAYNRPNSRARLQSRADDDEDDYSPQGKTKTAGLKRKLKTEDVSDDEEDEHVITPAKNKPTPKRRKSSAAQPASDDDDSEEDDFSDDTRPANSRRKSKGRKSTSNRENLTAEEKRQNHIKSEKQRRDLIKLQYDRLDAMVPGLKGGKSGLSRADIMNEISDYITSTMAGNDEIEQRLRDGRIGGRDADNDFDGDGAGGA